MKFSNATHYSVFPGAPLPSLADVEAAMAEQAFLPCGPSQESSIGFIPPRAENGPLIESVGGQWVAKLCIETRAVPASAIKRELKKRTDEIEKVTGRKPGKKEKRDLKEDIVHALLPMAFPRTTSVGIWIDPEARTLVVDTASQTKADTAVTAMVKAVEGLTLMMPVTTIIPAMGMGGWLHSMEAPAGFTIDRDCELRATDESRAVVRYTNHALDTDEVRDHIAKGKRPSRLAMTWEDRVSFVLTDAGTLRSIVFLETKLEATNDTTADEFDANVAIFTGELAPLLTAVLEALGGVAQAFIEEGAEEPATTDAAPLDGEPDAMYEKALAIVREHHKPSISLVQRHLQIGYNRAARLLEDMEKAGAVSPMDSVGSRTLIAA